MRLIDFVNLSDDGTHLRGKIYFNTEGESFLSNTSTWSADRYRHQWKHAVEYTISTGNTSCFIVSYDAALEFPKRIMIYTIIPEAMLKKVKSLKEKQTSENYYITNSFVFISENFDMANLWTDMNKIKETYGSLFPIYPFWNKEYERFYCYLESRTEGISSWKISKTQLLTVLDQT